MSKLLFLLGCIPIRLLLVLIAYILEKNKIKTLLLPIITLMIGIGFLIIYFKGWRKTGMEVEGKPIWWNNIRPVHGSLYILFSICYLLNIKNAWVILLADVLFGFFAFINNYYNK
jgi:hypothetical protein